MINSKIHIWHPKAMALFWGLTAVVAFGVILAVAESPDPAVKYVPIAGVSNPPTTDPIEAERAQNVVLASPQVRDVSKGRNVAVENPRPAVRNGDEIGTAVNLRLDQPMVAATNWLFLRCRMTRQVEQRITWSSVQLIRATVDSGGALIEFAPVPALGTPAVEGPIANESEAAAAPTTIRELPSGRVIWSSSPGHDLTEAGDFLRCPPGLADD